jgi:hypothetical protein
MSSYRITPLYAEVDSSKPVPPPAPKLNGGLYTGQPFAPDAPYANVPVVPDAGYLTHYNLQSAEPPEDARTQYPGWERPGNNHQPVPGVVKADGPYAIWCSTAACSLKGNVPEPSVRKPALPPPAGFSKHAFLSGAPVGERCALPGTFPSR